MKTENLLPLRQPQTNDYGIRPALSFIYRLILIFFACGYMICISGSVCAQTLGTYPTTTVVAGQNATVTPSAAPTGTTSIVAYTNTNFTGLLSVNPNTGVVTVTNPKQAGVYLITVRASDGALSTTTTFNLTVTDPVCSQALFEGTINMAVGSTPFSVAIGDFNGDGKQDFAAANSGSNNVSIRLGNGDGTFSGSTDVAVGAKPRSVAIGDFNGDGNQDIAVANASANSVSIRLGNGSGSFTASTDVPVETLPFSVAIGDFNADGNQDIAVANASSNSVSIRLGNGAGGFTGSTNVPVGTNPLSVAVGDFNGDGNMDFATANEQAVNVSIRLGNGLGGFSGSTDVAVGISPYSVAIGDFNCDGRQDIAVANATSNTVSIRFGNGLGRFSGGTNVAAGATPVSVAIGDFNGDGWQDFAAASINSSTVSIRLGDGLGGFSGSTNVAVGSAPWSVAIGDFNGDGKQDFLAANQSSNTVSIRLGGEDLVWYLDADNDNYYTGSGVTQCTTPGVGYKTTGIIGGGDCNDANAAINPGATEVCNGVDDDCDGGIGEDVPAAPTGSLIIVNSSCQNCTVTGGSIAIGSVSANGGGTLEYSINFGASWSSTLPTYNQTSSLTILASVVDAGGCRSTSLAVGTTLPGTCPPNGATWTARTAAAANQWPSVTYGNGLFVAVALSGTNRVMTSPDGITWMARAAGRLSGWQSVTYGNGLFVAVASTGTNRVMTSPDGISWTARTAPETNFWRSVTYGNGLFVAVASTGTNRVMTSPDGFTWTDQTAAEDNQWQSVTYGNGLFVAVAVDGTNRLMTSPNGITWKAGTAAEANSWRSVNYGNGLFVAVAESGANRVMTSPDGINWTARTAAEANSWYSVTYGNGLFVAVAENGVNRVMTSPDGINWTARTASEANSWRSVTYGNGLFVAVAENGTNRVMTSADGLPDTWYLDADNDNYYTGPGVTQCTSPGAGYKTTGLIGGGDCDDDNASINPGATEVCNNIDDDCDGQTDEGVIPTWYKDGDNDGYSDGITVTLCAKPSDGFKLAADLTAISGDCDDTKGAINPGATEVCGNNIDDNCNGSIDENCARTWYFDYDGDGYGNKNKPLVSLTKPSRYVDNGDDCRDWMADVYPGAPELPDNIDNDCDGETDEGLGCRRKWYFDRDGDRYGNPNAPFRWSCIAIDGYIDNNLDCRDWDATVNPAAAEICDGKDNDCDGLTDESCIIVGVEKGKPNDAAKPLAMAPVDDKALAVNLWPNPARDVLMVTLDEFVPNQKLDITLMQADGKIQQSQSLVPTIKGQKVRLDVGRAAGGYYILAVKQSGKIINRQVVILR